MKALTLIAAFFAVFLIFVGVSTRETAGALSNAVIVGGALILIFVTTVWFVALRQKKRSDDL